MTITRTLALAVCLAAALAACNNETETSTQVENTTIVPPVDTPAAPTAPPADTAPVAPVQPAAPAPVSTAASAFITDAGQRSKFEVDVSRMAMNMDVTGKYKEFAMTVITDHTNEDFAMVGILKPRGLALPTAVSADQTAQMERLKEVKDRRAFEKRYAQIMLQLHKDEVASFEQMSRNGADPQLQKMAADMLPSLRSHLQLAQQLSR